MARSSQLQPLSCPKHNIPFAACSRGMFAPSLQHFPLHYHIPLAASSCSSCSAQLPAPGCGSSHQSIERSHYTALIPVRQASWWLNIPQNNYEGLYHSETLPLPPRSCSCPGSSQAAAEGTAIYYVLLSIILGFKLIYYACKNGNTLASECLLGIQYPYYSKWLFLHN